MFLFKRNHINDLKIAETVFRSGWSIVTFKKFGLNYHILFNISITKSTIILALNVYLHQFVGANSFFVFLSIYRNQNVKSTQLLFKSYKMVFGCRFAIWGFSFDTYKTHTVWHLLCILHINIFKNSSTKNTARVSVYMCVMNAFVVFDF